MAKLLTRCPVCEGTLGISELTCGRCLTRIQGTFDPCRFCRLAPEHLAFVEMFLRCEGNLSRVEKEMSLSYPTVRNKLTAALAALGFADGTDSNSTPEVAPAFSAAFSFSSAQTPVTPPTPVTPVTPVTAPTPPTPEAGSRRREVLDALARGAMSAEEAAEALRDLS
jgi:hypothetical protein